MDNELRGGGAKYPWPTLKAFSRHVT